MATKTSIQRIRSTFRYTYTDLLPPITVAPGIYVTSSATRELVSTFSGSDNPHWRAQVKAGANATTAASGERQRGSFTKVPRLWSASVNGDFRYDGGGELELPGAIAPSGSISYTKADLIARSRFMKKYVDSIRSFSTGVFLGELRETLQMIRRPASAFRKGLDTYYGAVKERTRRIRSDRPKRAAVAGTWLEYSFGWGPLVNDIDDGMKALAETVCGKFVGELIQSTGSDESYNNVTSNASPVPGTSLDVTYRHKSVSSVRYKGMVATDIPHYPSDLSNWGISFSEIVPTIYELIPWSFLVDYFSNLGDVLTAVSYGSCSLRWGCKTQRTERTSTPMAYVIKPAGSGWLVGGAVQVGVKTSTYTHFNRSAVQSVGLGLSDLTWRIPGFESKKWLNIGALAALRR